ncbi:F0F1 ATP synthase subunit A [Halobacteriovorax sp. GB3]|uniref:F0F1 ATP synthase subunit A n=1 Tax=Halobacteriovorax sp. GB3 TaxID=2719615 RepID=UPI00235EBD13|nr:F0F1 ATP synthase subunit A [Halobacteriovorax sp. GB3]MDD0854720.1 F0F1 ATP synthase subunit A [Halobacteriovorax sp. GB3]
MKTLLFLLTSLLSVNVYAASGLIWLDPITHWLHHHMPYIDHHSAGAIVTFILVAIMLVITALIYRAKLSKVENKVFPDSGITFRNIVELYGSFIYSQCKAVLGEEDAPKYFKFIATIFLVIFISNVIGLIPGFLPPTEVVSTTLALGLLSFIYYNIKGCKELGVKNYLAHFAGPLWYMAILIFPIEILSNMIRPISLALRLRGNMMGDHMVLGTFLNLEILGFKVAYLGAALPFYFLGLLVCFIQAYVFTMLSMVYISLATAHHDHDEHHAH